MKTSHFAIFAVLATIVLLFFCIDAQAAAAVMHGTLGGTLIAPIAATALEDLPELAQKLRDKHDEIGQRMTDLEQAVVKGIRGITESGLPSPGVDVKTIIEDPGFDAIRSGTKGSAREFALGAISLKALVNLVTDDPSSGNTGYPTPATRLPGRLGSPLAPLRLLNVLPSRPVDSNKVEYVQLNSTGDAAVQDGEGEEKAEMDFEGDLVTANVATIAVHTTASAQVLDDAQGLQALIERVLANKVLSKAEEQLITGSGTGNFIDGLNTQATAIHTGETGIPERIGSALSTMETAGYSPDLILMNPADWFAVSILKDADGNYIYGNPASPAPPSLWNRPVVRSPKVPQGIALVGDSTQVTVLDRMAPTVFISRDHKDYRTRNLVLILVETRLGLELYDTAGFRKVDLEGSE